MAQMLATAGVDIDDVFDIVNAWLAGVRPVWLRVADDQPTGLRYSVLWARAGTGRPLCVLARVIGSDLHVVGAAHMNAEQVTEFEKWEATHHD